MQQEVPEHNGHSCFFVQSRVDLFRDVSLHVYTGLGRLLPEIIWASGYRWCSLRIEACLIIIQPAWMTGILTRADNEGNRTFRLRNDCTICKLCMGDNIRTAFFFRSYFVLDEVELEDPRLKLMNTRAPHHPG